MLVGACKHAAVLARRSNDFVHVAILTLEIGFESEAGPKTPSTLTSSQCPYVGMTSTTTRPEA